jgi:hypothetical protein
MTEPTSSGNGLKLAFAGLGCIGFLTTVGMLGFVYFRLQTQPDIGQQTVELSVPAPIQTEIFTLSDAAPGTTLYQHHSDCSSVIDGLTLKKMSFEFPSDMEVRSACSDSNYVTLARIDDAGNIQQLMGFGFANIPLRIDDPVVEQLISLVQGAFANVATSRPMSSEPLSARGTKLISRKQFLKIHTRSGSYVEGDYVNQVIMVPGPNDNGISLLGMVRVEDSVDTATALQESILTDVVNSIDFLQ